MCHTEFVDFYLIAVMDRLSLSCRFCHVFILSFFLLFHFYITDLFFADLVKHRFEVGFRKDPELGVDMNNVKYVYLC